jgi:hypothetical protein
MPTDKSSPATLTSAGADSIPATKWLELYKEICINIRTTDDISFKLLGFVPAFAGSAAGALTLLEKSELLKAAAPGVVLALATVGLGATFGLFRWELRNVQKCNWLIDRAAELERYALSSGREPLAHIQYLEWSNEPRPTLKGWKWPWGKTESEVVVYSAAMLAWCVPAALAVVSLW